MLKQYDDMTLKKLREVQMDLLDELKRICNKYNLKYFAVFGTLLGAVRHKGYIPWDDDLDVGMIREDYEKFLFVAQKECGERIFVQTKETDKEYHLPFGKLRMNKTKFIEPALKNNSIHQGIYIDIFPFDGITDDEQSLKKQIRKNRKWITILSIRYVRTPQIADRGNVANFVIRTIWRILHWGMKIFNFSPIYIERKIDKYTKEMNSPHTSRVTCFDAGAFDSITPRQYLTDLIEVSYENTTITIPKEYDYILSKKFGDYMKLPPVEKRVNHCPNVIEFADVEDEMIRVTY